MDQNIAPSSLKLKSSIKTSQGVENKRKVERQLINEGLQSINSTIEIFTHMTDTCMNDVEKVLSKHMYNECNDFIHRVRQSSHTKILERL